AQCSSTICGGANDRRCRIAVGLCHPQSSLRRCVEFVLERNQARLRRRTARLASPVASKRPRCRRDLSVHVNNRCDVLREATLAFASLVGCTCMFFSCDLLGQTDRRLFETCYGGGTPDNVITACTVMITRQQGDNHDLATAFKNRGNAYDDKR